MLDWKNDLIIKIPSLDWINGNFACQFSLVEPFLTSIIRMLQSCLNECPRLIKIFGSLGSERKKLISRKLSSRNDPQRCGVSDYIFN